MVFCKKHPAFYRSATDFLDQWMLVPSVIAASPTVRGRDYDWETNQTITKETF